MVQRLGYRLQVASIEGNDVSHDDAKCVSSVVQTYGASGPKAKVNFVEGLAMGKLLKRTQQNFGVF